MAASEVAMDINLHFMARQDTSADMGDMADMDISLVGINTIGVVIAISAMDTGTTFVAAKAISEAVMDTSAVDIREEAIGAVIIVDVHYS